MHPSLRRAIYSAAVLLVPLAAPRLATQSAPGAALACREVPGWPRLAPGDTLGMVSGVAVDPAGHVVAFRRAGRRWDSDTLDMSPIARPTVLVLDAGSGAVLRA